MRDKSSLGVELAACTFSCVEDMIRMVTQIKEKTGESYENRGWRNKVR